MSYPGGFSRLHISDEGTHKMATRDGNVGRHVDKDLPSTSEEALSCVDATRVIT